MGLLYTQLLERLDKVVAERDAALADAQVEKTRADELNWEVERLSKAASKKIESLEKDLAQAISERTPHDYGILKEEVDYWKAETHRVAKKRDEALDEVEQLKQALHDARLENSGQAMLLERKRPEPSRLEIAAMAMQGFLASSGWQMDVPALSLKLTDALIKAEKEGK